MTSLASDCYQCNSKRFPFRSKFGQVEIGIVLPRDAPPSNHITRVAIVCHGHERDAHLIHQQASSACTNPHSTLIIAPQFYNGLDKEKFRQDPAGYERLLVWKGNGWAEGSPSVRNNNVEVSSFETLDAIISQYSNRAQYPSIDHIVLAGHSLGGQLVQRYSILNDVKVPVKLSYIVMNPSTYFYPDIQYEYKYGLKGIESALSMYPPALLPAYHLWQRIQNREVHYLIGSKDKGVGDEREEAMKQGQNRQERYTRWQTYLQSRSLDGKVSFDQVPGAGHDANQMLHSPIAQHYTFHS